MTDSTKRIFIRVTHLLPLFLGLLLLILGLIPCFFYYTVQSGAPGETLSLFDLLENTFTTCLPYLNHTVEDGSAAGTYFAYAMFSLMVLSWILMTVYAIFALFTAFLGICAFSSPGALPTVNTLKRAYRILVPARAFYVIFSLFPVLVSLFPHALLFLYRKLLLQDVTLYYSGLPTVVYTTAVAAVLIAPFLLSLRWQKDLKMDLFRLYKQ